MQEHLAAEVTDLASTLERALDNACSGLHRAAIQLGAECAAVCLAANSGIEVTWFWSSNGEGPASRRLSRSQQTRYESTKANPGAVEAGSPLAKLFSESISPHSRSFLLFPSQVRQGEIAVLFGFPDVAPPFRHLPESIVEGLKLAGLATWSVLEIAMLRAELRRVSDRLAGRKLVERAKSILQVERGVSEEQAYEYMRGLSRQRRISLAEFAGQVVQAHASRNQVRLPACRALA
jgi:hypothetical protein